MLLAFVLAAIICSVAAYAPSQSKARSTKLFSDAPAAMDFEAIPEPPAPPVKKVRIAAKWLPIGGMKAPLLLDGSMPGDVGFDPFGFSSSEKTLFWMREAEIKHARLAMLAAVGWPISELYHKSIASAFGLTSILAPNDKAPSLLNGGLDSVWSSGILVMSIMLAGYLEGQAMNSGEIFWGSTKPKDYVPGDIGFDPLNLKKVRGDLKTMQLAEVKNGRLAMIAITAYAAQEAVSGLPVIQETPYLF